MRTKAIKDEAIKHLRQEFEKAGVPTGKLSNKEIWQYLWDACNKYNNENRFFYQTGFIKERTDKGEEIVADFFGGTHLPARANRAERIIRLLNLGYEKEKEWKRQHHAKSGI